MIEHAVAAAGAATQSTPIVVLAPGMDAVRDLLGAGAECVEQAEARGTGDALRSVPARLRGDGPVLVTYGDVPLLRPGTLRSLLDTHAASGRRCTLLTVPAEGRRGLGRVRRDAAGAVTAVVEERDLPAGAEPPPEGNAGVYVFDGAALWPALDRLRPDNSQGELYLTDVVAMLAPAAAFAVEDPGEVVGVNDRRDLAAAEAALRHRILDDLMASGVTVEDPATTYVDAGVEVGRDTVLHPMTVLRGGTRLGEGCEVGPMAQLRDVRAGSRVRIGASSLEESLLEDDVVVGEYARLRPGTVLRRGVRIGTHAEIKNSTVGEGSQVGHFSCVLDSDVGSGVNIGAGTVTCNYDGRAKHRTVIDDGVFVGSDCMLVAPLRVGSGAYLAAGSVITRDVPDGALAIERSEQRIVAGWAERRRRAQVGSA